MKFDPPILRWSALVSLLGLALLAAACARKTAPDP
jgi:hypothetical protein